MRSCGWCTSNGVGHSVAYKQTRGNLGYSPNPRAACNASFFRASCDGYVTQIRWRRRQVRCVVRQVVLDSSGSALRVDIFFFYLPPCRRRESWAARRRRRRRRTSLT